MEEKRIDSLVIVPTGQNNKRFTGTAQSLSLLEKLEIERNAGKERKGKKIGNRARVAALHNAFVNLLEYVFDQGLVTYGSDCIDPATEMIAKCLSYTARDIELFSAELSRHEQAEDFQLVAGSLLTALVRNSKERKFTIHTKNLDNLPHELGKDNKKHVTVIGSLGNEAGSMMTRGKLEVHGDVGKEAGEYLKGGVIIVHGNAGERPGYCMQGGKIVVMGRIESLDEEEMEGGSIFQGDRQIVKNGKRTKEPINK